MLREDSDAASRPASSSHWGWTVSEMPDQSGRTVLVTVANSGIGLESARAFAQRGARVLLACRNLEKGTRACAEVAAVARGEEPRLLRLDLADLASVRVCAQEVLREEDRIDALLLNAGVRVVATASLAHWLGRTRWTDPNWEGRWYEATRAYGQSKRRAVRFVYDRLMRYTTQPTAAGALPQLYASTMPVRWDDSLPASSSREDTLEALVAS